MLAGPLLVLAIIATPVAPLADSQAVAAFAGLKRLHTQLSTARSTPAGYEAAASRYLLAKRAKSKRLSELFKRTADDQFYRASFAFGAPRGPAAHLNAAEAAAYDQLVGRAMMAQDKADTAWLKVQLKEIGWFAIGRYGEDADEAAWLLVQHADADPDFQQVILGRLEALRSHKETSARNYAYLFDRVALARGRPQRYGTQFKCLGPGVITPRDVEAPAGLDARRAALGMEPEADYLDVGRPLCTQDERAPAKAG